MVLPLTMPRLSFLWHSPGMTEITIPFLLNFEAGAGNVVAHVEIGRKDQWKALGTGEGRELSVFTAFLRGVVIHKGLRFTFLLSCRGIGTYVILRGLFTRFPLLTSLMAAATFFFISFVILASCVLPLIEWQVQDNVPSTEPAPQEKPRRQRRQERDESRSARRRTLAQQRSQSLGASSRAPSVSLFPPAV